MCTTEHMWRSQDNLWELALFMWPCGSPVGSSYVVIWVPRMELGVSGLPASAFPCWAISLVHFCWICFWIFLLLYLFSFKARYNYWVNYFSVDLNHWPTHIAAVGTSRFSFLMESCPVFCDISTAGGFGLFLHKTLNLLSVYFNISFFFVREIFKH